MKTDKSKFAGVALQTREGSNLVGQQSHNESRVDSSDSSAKLKTDLVTCLDGRTRMMKLNRLKAQIHAETYHVDSHAIAYKILQTPYGSILKADHQRAQTLNIDPASVRDRISHE